MKKILLLLVIGITAVAKAQTYQVGPLKIAIQGTDSNFTRDVHVSSKIEGVYEIELRLNGTNNSMPGPVILKFKLPSVDIQNYLVPHGADATAEPTTLYNYELARMIPVSFAAKPIFTSAMIDQPSMTFLSSHNENRLTISASELIYPVTFNAGENEDDGAGFDIRMGLFEYPTKKMTTYKVKVRLDFRTINYNIAQRDLLHHWETEDSLKFAYIPKKSHLPFYSTWYALKADGVNEHNIEQQASIAHQLGCETIIVDDGWQKSRESKLGYCLYNGDWTPDKARFKDFKSHVAKIHQLGMNYMLWVGPSMIGEKSAAYQLLKDKMLYKADWASAWVVDPRFPEVRKYLASTLINLMKSTGIDGFKIDFLDLFNTRYAGSTLSFGNGRDYESVEEATVKLIADIYAGCRTVNPEVLIEFRQFYTSPILQQYANMFRAVDCPNSVMANRARTLDARNLNMQVIHADPLVWNENEKPQISALQFLNTMLSVPQISTDLSRMNAAQMKMLKFLLKLWQEFNQVLTRGKAFNYGPDSYYSWSEVSLEDQTVIAAYQAVVLKPSMMKKHTMIVNGTHSDNIVLDIKQKWGIRKVEIYSCTGELVKKVTLNFQGLLKIDVPPSGIIRVEQ